MSKPKTKLAELSAPRRKNRAVDAMPDAVVLQAAEAVTASSTDVGGMPAPKPVSTSHIRNRNTSLRRSQPGVRLAVYIPMDLEQALRERSAAERASMSVIVTEALGAYLEP